MHYISSFSATSDISWIYYRHSWAEEETCVASCNSGRLLYILFGHSEVPSGLFYQWSCYTVEQCFDEWGRVLFLSHALQKCPQCLKHKSKFTGISKAFRLYSGTVQTRIHFLLLFYDCTHKTWDTYSRLVIYEDIKEIPW